MYSWCWSTHLGGKFASDKEKQTSLVVKNTLRALQSKLKSHPQKYFIFVLIVTDSGLLEGSVTPAGIALVATHPIPRPASSLASITRT